MARGIELTLYDAAGAVYASGVDIAVMWFDHDAPPDLGKIVGTSGVATTTAGGVLTLDIEQVSGLSVGDWGFVVLYKADVADYKDSPVFASRVEVETVTGGTVLKPLSDWVRPAGWLALDVDDGDEKFQGLLAVYPESNFVAIRAQGAYTVNWGDGSAAADFASDAQGEKNISYGDIDPLTDLGLADEQTIAVDGSTDVITAVAHGYVDDQTVHVYALAGTSGPTVHSAYYVRDKTADTFKIAATPGGTAIDFTGSGTGKVYAPVHRQCLVTLTMQGGQTFTLLSLNQKHTQSGLSTLSSNHWIDAAVSAAALSTLVVGGTSPLRQYTLQSFSLIGVNAVTNFSNEFNNCYALQSVLLDTSSGTNFSSMFSSCRSLRSIPLLDTSSGTNFSSMLSNCSSLQSVPLLDTSAGLDISSMFNNCNTLQAIPLLDTGLVTDFTSAFGYCFALETIPLFNTSSGTIFSQLFYSSTSLKTIPLLDTSSGVSFNFMFNGCLRLESIPLLDTSSGTNFAYMFFGCSVLKALPLLDTSSGDSFSNMLNNCPSLQSIPLWDVSLGTNFSNMFGATSAELKEAALKGTRYSINYSNCKLSAAALNRIYQNLGAPNGGAQTITVTTNWGTSGDNPALVPGGWTVSGS